MQSGMLGDWGDFIETDGEAHHVRWLRCAIGGVYRHVSA